MTNTRLILFRLSNLGEPVNNENIKNGVLTLPADDYPQGFKSGDALFELRFQLNAASQVSRKGVFHTNVPKSFDIDFDRNKHNAYPIESSFHQDITINIPIYKPGAYNYYFTYEDENGNEKETAKFYFNVPPHLELDGKFVPFNSINVETVVSKWIGPYERWNKFFGIVKAKGYNMVHFTPLQERGESDSPYSIYDQLKWDPKIFSDQSKATKEIHKVLNDNKLLSITDVVWNHTANNSEWLKSAPESGYTQDTAPHLNAAIELDAKLLEFSEKLEDLGLPIVIESEDDLQKIVTALKSQVHDELKLWQYYVFDRKKEVEKVLDTFKSGSDISKAQIPSSVNTNDLNQIAQYTLENASDNKQAILGRRFENELNPRSFLSILYAILGDSVEENALEAKVGEIVDEINAPLYAQYDDDVKTIDQQVADRIRFLRLADNGPRLGKITEKNPLTEPYFTRFVDANGKKQALANNGWIWGGNPLVDFASNKSKAYLRREVIVWGDCVKLRYGAKYEDSPKLWDRIIEYTKEMARVFNGFRIDNCHSTPLPVAERLLDEARKVNPDLYVIAELFSGSEEMDKIFVERLALNSLVREAMQAWSVAELSTLVHKHGGRPIGSLTWLPLSEFSYPASKEPKLDSSHGGYTEMEIPKVLTSTAPHAIFMDCTHDNETPAQKRTVEDTLPNAALVAFCSSAIGSVYGFDECYPHLLNVVDEKRQYSLDDSDNVNNGIGKVKAKLNNIRQQLAEESEDIARDHEMYIHHEGQYITIQRYNARSGKGWFLIARTKFTDHEGEQILSPSTLGGTKVKHEFSYTLKKVGEYEKNDKVLSGIPVQVEEIEAPTVEDANGDSIIKVNDSFIPGSIAVFSTEIPGVDKKLDDYVRKGAVEASVNLDLYDLNNLLYRCSPEELDASGGKEDVYDIPGYGRLVYAGLEGWQSALKEVIWSNNLGSSICDHFRQGSWAADYVVNRLDKYASSSKGLQRFQTWLRERFDAVKNVPYYLRPHYFALIIGIAYEAARFRVLRLLTPEIQVATNFVQSLALTSVQMVGTMNNTSLLPDKSVPCLAAGLPHFSNDYMRCWGRDVFISFRGLLIVPERFDDAKQHILAFAKTLKHGLIPNLLDAGRNPRYNARDAAWFFLQAIQEYVVNVPSGEEILKEKVSRRFPLDDRYIKHDDPEAFSYESSIEDIIFEILERHAKGIKYREANAGPNLDSQMKPEGFDVEVGVDWETGLVHGGQQLNCGTWMDKMGESERAHNKGIPGTPRDGAAVEIQGLLKSALRWVNELSKKGQFKHKEVTKPNGSKITLKEWEQLVQENFERKFYVPEDANEDGEYDIDSSLVNRRGIYKDLYKSGKPYEDYQLRANFPIAMCVAPELFDKHHGLVAIRNADKIIRGPVGIRTLDPSDYNYRPYYNNSVDNDDFATSKGRNYHQGPEWVWCYGYFLRAFLYFNFAEDDTYSDGHKPSNELFTLLNTRIQHHIKWIKQSPWAGLTELTNKDGELCHDSSPTQAWSSSCLLDLYYDLWNDSRYQG